MRIRSVSPKERAKAKESISHEGSVKTICQLLRDIYMASSKNRYIAIRALDAYCYAKRMNKALRDRNGVYDQGWWIKGDYDYDESEPETPFTTA